MSEEDREIRAHRRLPVSLDRLCSYLSSVMMAGAALATGQSSTAAVQTRAPADGSARGKIQTSTITF